jgi:predicted DNA-binding protein (MmcQ/YjbR family)
MADKLLQHLRKICLAFPEATEKLTWEDSNTFRVRDKIFAMTAHDEDGNPSVWCKAAPGAQEVLVGADPDRFYVPPYVGSKGWIGIYMDRRMDWGQVQALVDESFRLVAPKRLVKTLDER